AAPICRLCAAAESTSALKDSPRKSALIFTLPTPPAPSKWPKAIPFAKPPSISRPSVAPAASAKPPQEKRNTAPLNANKTDRSGRHLDQSRPSHGAAAGALRRSRRPFYAHIHACSDNFTSADDHYRHLSRYPIWACCLE